MKVAKRAAKTQHGICIVTLACASAEVREKVFKKIYDKNLTKMVEIAITDSAT